MESQDANSTNPPAPIYEIPNWASVPPPGMHLDVMKGDKLFQKLMIDQKRCYLFGRNSATNDFCIDHGSCSRNHAALVYHQNLERAFLVDLGSTHGTFIGNLRIEPDKPVQILTETRFHFGASTREYIIRERPTSCYTSRVMEELERATSRNEDDFLGLPEVDNEMDNVTELNTAHNRHIPMVGITDEESRRRKRKRVSVRFSEEDEVINPEDVDPNVGRFRNLICSQIIPSTKKPKLDTVSPPASVQHKHHCLPRISLYDDLPQDSSQSHFAIGTPFFTTVTSSLGIPTPNPAPEINAVEDDSQVLNSSIKLPYPRKLEFAEEPKKKKYAKEAWPGKKPGSTNINKFY